MLAVMPQLPGMMHGSRMGLVLSFGFIMKVIR